MPPPWGRPYHTATGFREMPTVDRLSAVKGPRTSAMRRGLGALRWREMGSLPVLASDTTGGEGARAK